MLVLKKTSKFFRLKLSAKSIFRGDLMIDRKKNIKLPDRGYMVQLDSLRAIAVLSVMLSHFTPANVPNSLASSLVSIYDWFPGVSLFFVLSGFLITGILLRCRDTIESNNQSFGFTLGRFYIRRFLRILPIYYVTLFLTAPISNQIRSVFFWHLTYTTNIMVFLRTTFDETSSHFWSLSMEEQFYIFWPFLILLTPKKHLLKVIITTVVLAIISRFGCYFIGLNSVQIYVFPLSSLDTLGLGALLAFFTHYQNHYARAKRDLCNFGLWVCLPAIVSFIFLNLIVFNEIEMFEVLIKPTVVAIFYVWLVDRAAEGFDGNTGAILELKPLVFIGKISYGLYLYHCFMNPFLSKLFLNFDLSDKISISFAIVLKVTATFAIAIVSWFLIEKPINSLKHRFNYQKKY
jgi:peptidoglycan/LPS O-acetylase OafA/YrhL